MTIIIRTIETIEDCHAVERLQMIIWGNDSVEFGSHVMRVIALEGGVVLLALDNGEPVGFSFAFPALTDDNQLKLASHQTGVLPRYQSGGLGYQLKLYQRQAALKRHYKLITWTFDPLQGRNARLNLGKLGAVCNSYKRHFYGDMTDALNRGLPSDRFKVDWWIDSDHVKERLAGKVAEPAEPSPTYPLINPGPGLHEGFLLPAETFQLPDTPYCLLQVPPDLPALKAHAPELARQWRLHTRAVFEACFGRGYTAVNLLPRQDCNYYLLQKDFEPR
jgi:predicted GNAT superfamily acetyltransferase